MNDITAIEKGQKNTQQNFNYRGIDDIMNALKPLLVKHEVLTACNIAEQSHEIVTDAKGRQTIRALIKLEVKLYCSADGSNISVSAIGEAMDYGDKAFNKAMSIAYKYAMLQTFCIPTEMVDPDSNSYEIGNNQIQKVKEKYLLFENLLTAECQEKFKLFINSGNYPPEKLKKWVKYFEGIEASARG